MAERGVQNEKDLKTLYNSRKIKTKLRTIKRPTKFCDIERMKKFNFIILYRIHHFYHEKKNEVTTKVCIDYTV